LEKVRRNGAAGIFRVELNIVNAVVRALYGIHGLGNIPDTTGYTVPEQYGELIRSIRENVPNIERATISVHCHDDLGLAVANSLAGIRNGARQVEGTINGIGERAGNAALEEIVMGIRTRADYYGVSTGVEPREFFRTSRMVADMLGMPVPANKAVVGSNAFAHSPRRRSSERPADLRDHASGRRWSNGEPGCLDGAHRPGGASLKAGEVGIRALQAGA
jgi:isopropylmalate/homocitrate/citramalate synthase